MQLLWVCSTKHFACCNKAMVHHILRPEQPFYEGHVQSWRHSSSRQDANNITQQECQCYVCTRLQRSCCDSDPPPLSPLCEKMTSSTKPLLKLWFIRYARGQTDRQTDRQTERPTDKSNTRSIEYSAPRSTATLCDILTKHLKHLFAGSDQR